MSDANREDVTRLLAQLSDGDGSAMDQLFPLVYGELKALAAHVVNTPNHTLQATALVHEAYIRMARQDGGWNDRKHFFNVAAKAMRQLLTDHARKKAAAKRGGDLDRVSFSEGLFSSGDELDLVAFDDALRTLERLDERQARVVELRFIVGLSIEDTAETLGISPRTVNVDWQMARAWLRRELSKGENESC